MDNAKPKIRKYILENFLYTSEDGVLDDATSFVKSGIVDSTGILEIVNFIEEEFGIKIEDEEVTPMNLDSVESITNFIARKSLSAENS